MTDVSEELRAIGDVVVRREVPLAPYTSMRVGGPAELLVAPRGLEALRRTLALLTERGVPWFVLGNGSNLLVRDGGVRGAAVTLEAMPATVEADGPELKASAQMLLVHLVQEGHRLGLTGLEWAVGIPGSLGGAAVMNAGCHGEEFGRHVSSVTVVEGDGTVREVGAEALGFAYRRSSLHRPGLAVVAVTLRLAPGDPEEGRRLVRHFLRLRRETQPVGLSAGSMFKNPPGDYAGRLIELVGGKGRRHGDAEISSKHANFVVNRGRAQATDVLALTEWAKARVREAFGIALELEVDIVGEEKAP